MAELGAAGQQDRKPVIYIGGRRIPVMAGDLLVNDYEWGTGDAWTLVNPALKRASGELVSLRGALLRLE